MRTVIEDIGSQRVQLERTGKRFVTEVTLIYSSRCSDSVNVSRDVTFRQHLKRLLEHSSFHVWLCVGYPMINRRGWWLEGNGRVGWSGGLWMGMHAAARPALPPDPDAFANYLFVYFRGLQNVTRELRSRLSLQTSRIALKLINLGWTIPSISTLGQTLNRFCRTAVNH